MRLEIFPTPRSLFLGISNPKALASSPFPLGDFRQPFHPKEGEENRRRGRGKKGREKKGKAKRKSNQNPSQSKLGVCSVLECARECFCSKFSPLCREFGSVKSQEKISRFEGNKGVQSWVWFRSKGEQNFGLISKVSHGFVGYQNRKIFVPFPPLEAENDQAWI